MYIVLVIRNEGENPEVSAKIIQTEINDIVVLNKAEFVSMVPFYINRAGLVIEYLVTFKKEGEKHG